jgi:death-on-curing family protein
VPAATLTADVAKTNSLAVESSVWLAEARKTGTVALSLRCFLDCLATNPNADIAKLAAAYGFGLAKNYAFVDGNKRVAFVATALFLRLNGWRLATERLDEIQTVLNLAWIRANCEKRRPESIRRKK